MNDQLNLKQKKCISVKHFPGLSFINWLMYVVKMSFNYIHIEIKKYKIYLQSFLHHLRILIDEENLFHNQNTYKHLIKLHLNDSCTSEHYFLIKLNMLFN